MTGARNSYTGLILCLIAQAALLTYRLDLLPMWGDELFTVYAAGLPVGKMIDVVRADVHPPLYFLLAHYWIRLVPGDALARLRLLSVIFTLLATIALDRLWMKHAPPRARAWCLALWTLSACLLLYSRMARSYSLQVLGFIVVGWAASRWRQLFISWLRMLIFAVSLLVLLYTHYVPGFAAWAGANLLLVREARRCPRPWLIGNALALAGCLPWLTLTSIRSAWLSRPGLLVTSNSIAETGIKLGYGIFSFLYGEAIPVWLLPVTALLAIPAAWLLWKGAAGAREWIIPIACAAVLGFLVVAAWVSYAFVPARLLFLLPLVLLAIAAGINCHARAGTLIASALMAANLIGIVSYFQARDLLNVGYIAPLDRMARDIAASSARADTTVFVDGRNLSSKVLEFYLPGFTVRQIFTADQAEAAWREANAPAIRHVWLLRNPHDLTPEHALERLESGLRESFSGQLHPYMPYSPTHKFAMRIVGMQVSSDYLYASWEFTKPN